jgi:hypothetical protein
MSSRVSALLALIAIIAATVGGALAGSTIAAGVTEQGVTTVVVQNPSQYEQVPEWAGRSKAGFTGFGGLPALPGRVFRTGVVAANEDGDLTVESSSATTTVSYRNPRRLFQIELAATPLVVGDVALVRYVNGRPAGVLRLLIEAEDLQANEAADADSDSASDSD